MQQRGCLLEDQGESSGTTKDRGERDVVGASPARDQGAGGVRTMGGSRGQSSAMGTLLMVGLAIVLAGATGAFVYDLADTPEDPGPSAAVSVTATGGEPAAHTLTVTHEGGDAMPLSEYDVVIEDDGTRTRLPLTSFSNRSGTTDGVADAGDVLRTAFLLDGPTRVELVHRPSGTVLARDDVALPAGSPSIVDFEAADPTQSFESNQDGVGETTVGAGGATVEMSGNQWKYVDHSYTVTAETVLVFEFNSTAEGEIHGVGLEDDQQQTSDRIVKAFGTQNWGEPVSQFDGAEMYALGDGWVRYEIPIGELYEANGDLGPTDFLVFVTDCDTGTGCPTTDDGTPNATSQFRNVRVYENSTAPAITPRPSTPIVRATTDPQPVVISTLHSVGLERTVAVARRELTA